MLYYKLILVFFIFWFYLEAEIFIKKSSKNWEKFDNIQLNFFAHNKTTFSREFCARIFLFFNIILTIVYSL